MVPSSILDNRQYLRMSFPWVSVCHSHLYHFSTMVFFHSAPWNTQAEAVALWLEQQLSSANCHIRHGYGCVGLGGDLSGLPPAERFWFTSFNDLDGSDNGNYAGEVELRRVLFDVDHPEEVLKFNWRRPVIGTF
jgi:hypothetical protein